MPPLSPLNFPLITIQHDLTSVISDVREGTVVDEDAWVSCYSIGKNSFHGKIHVSRGAGRDADVLLAPRDSGLDFVKRNGVSVSLCPIERCACVSYFQHCSGSFNL